MCEENINKLIKIYFDTQCALAEMLEKMCKHDDSEYFKLEKTFNDVKYKLIKLNAKL